RARALHPRRQRRALRGRRARHRGGPRGRRDLAQPARRSRGGEAMSRARAFDPAADGPSERYEAQDVVSAIAVSLIVLFGFILMFQSPPRALKMAEISDEKAQPIAVSITPVPLLKQGSKTPTKLPDSWQRQPKPAVKKDEAPLPSPQAAKTPDAIPSTASPDAAVAPVLVDAASPGPTDP